MRLRPAIPPSLLPQARAAFKANDWDRFFGSTDSDWSLWLLGMNHQAIRNKGEYEHALLVAWVNQKVTRVILNGEPLNWTPYMKRYLASCDRSKLVQAGDPLPEGEPLTVYRGLPNSNSDVRGVSWTLDIEVARRFAEGFMVYKTTVPRSMAYAYVNESGRGEREVMLVLPADYPVVEIKNV
jgi:hypothetical protein